MKRNTGHVLRISGLLIEMLGVWGVMNAAGNQNRAQPDLGGLFDIPPAWVALGVGFLLWLTGTAIVYSGRPRRKPVQNEASEPPYLNAP